MKRVVVTGIGALTAIGNNVPEYLEGLKAGKSGAKPITQFDAEKFKTQFACEVTDWDPTDRLDRKVIRRLDRYITMALYAADEAMKQAGILTEEGTKAFELNPDRAGAIVASGIGGLGTLEKEIMDFSEGSGVPRYNPFMIPKMIANMGAGHISMAHNLRGPSYATVSACASGGHALAAAADDIRMDRADFMVTGGSEAVVTKVGIGGFNSMKALSTRNDDFKTASRPYDAERDGFVLGEGAGIIILESLDHALARGANILAEVAGYAASSDAYHISAPHPEGAGAKMAMANAMKYAGLNRDRGNNVPHAPTEKSRSAEPGRPALPFGGGRAGLGRKGNRRGPSGPAKLEEEERLRLHVREQGGVPGRAGRAGRVVPAGNPEGGPPEAAHLPLPPQPRPAREIGEGPCGPG